MTLLTVKLPWFEVATTTTSDCDWGTFIMPPCRFMTAYDNKTGHCSQGSSRVTNETVSAANAINNNIKYLLTDIK
jgi:hypothetical protein